jgi:hypothetical protein
MIIHAVCSVYLHGDIDQCGTWPILSYFQESSVWIFGRLLGQWIRPNANTKGHTLKSAYA